MDGQGQAHDGGVERNAGFLFGLPDGGVEDVLAFFEVAAGEAELAAGIDVPCSAQQQDPPGMAQDDVDR